MEQLEIIKSITNLGDSGQDTFVSNYIELAKTTLYEQGVSKLYLSSTDASYTIAKVITDLIEDGTLSNTTLSIVATLRVNHPHTEDE